MFESILTKKNLAALLGFCVRGAKWYVKYRYGVDVDQILKERESGDKPKD